MYYIFYNANIIKNSFVNRLSDFFDLIQSLLCAPANELWTKRKPRTPGNATGVSVFNGTIQSYCLGADNIAFN